MNTNAFKYIATAKYPTGEVSDYTGSDDYTTATIQVKYNNESLDNTPYSFIARFPNIFDKYTLPNVSSDEVVGSWRSDQMSFWQNQLNFATWCASTGCGVSLEDHLNSPHHMIRSLYRFHFYYQVRRILETMQVVLPQDKSWDPFNNAYDRRAYERICSEYDISPNANWRPKGPNNGLGRVYFYAGHQYMPVYGAGDPDVYDPKTMSFTETTTNSILHVDFIKQEIASWGKFVLAKSQGLTAPGVERLNDSIRTYVWSILSAQALTRSAILGSGTSFDAQKQFLANMEDVISSPVDLHTSIVNYQKYLQKANTQVNYVFGTGLYIAPSDMRFNFSFDAGYHNQIIIAPDGQPLGVSLGINDSPVPPPVETGETGLVVPQQSDTLQSTAAPDPPSHPPEQTQKAQEHEDEKAALVVGGVAIGLAALALGALRR